jgi:hypothetical protein
MARKKRIAGLPRVYAKGDSGVLLPGTRWEPRRVSCTRRADRSDAPVDYAVKYHRSEPVGAAALISEVVSHALLQRLQIPTLSAALVQVSPALARLYAEQQRVEYPVAAGLHFGTLYRPDVEPADPKSWTPAFWDDLADPAELVAIWAADSWLMNLDRIVQGNILLEVDPQGKAHLIAADQSDCFLGAGALADGSCFGRSRGHGAAPYLPLLELTFLQLGVAPLRQVVERIRGVGEIVPEATARVPEEWWRQANGSPQTIIDCLAERASRIDRIVELEKWEGITGATQGGRRLNL